MQQQSNLVENLIALRNHYQGLLAGHERSVAHTLEQLTHINALLVDQLVENQQCVQSLMELRSHYLSLHEEHKRTVAHAREQLDRVKALLADELLLQHQQHQPLSIEASMVNEIQNLRLKAANTRDEESFQLSDQAKELNNRQERSLHQADKSEQPISSAPTEMMQIDRIDGQTSSISEESSSHLSQFSAVKTPLLPKYQHLTKTQAVEQMLREHEGTILHVDYIIRSLYGELSADDIKAEKPRIYDTLSRGVEKGLWDKVPDQASCYTIDLKLLEPELTAKKTAQLNKVNSRPRRPARGQRSEEMLPRYQQFNFTEAVAAVVQEHAGEILTTDRVAQELYGELSGQALTKAKDKIGKTLWSGAKQNRWQRVPGQLGRYTLNLKSVGL